MAEKLFESSCNPTGPFKEAVCVDAARIYDSCGEQDVAPSPLPIHQTSFNRILTTNCSEPHSFLLS